MPRRDPNPFEHVCNEDATKWDEVRVLLSHGGKGSAAFVTSWSIAVSAIIGPIDAYNFKKRALNSVEESSHFIRIERKLLRSGRAAPRGKDSWELHASY